MSQCRVCDRFYCSECNGEEFYQCMGDDCDKANCIQCTDDGHVRWCNVCERSFCTDCRLKKCKRGRMKGCSGCVTAIAPILLEEVERLTKLNEKLLKRMTMQHS
mmetsp:Transcript_32122/g.55884  ORF Transcript_32122/g.55884 Transcript_32122/m.55884 type:complete len:104 (+) Transcript_32122:81-392(+)